MKAKKKPRSIRVASDDGLERDAKRYRWIRGHPHAPKIIGVWYGHETLDEHIDKAMTRSNEQN